MLVFCDLDGTVADNSHRQRFVREDKHSPSFTVFKKDWDSFYKPELVIKDLPITAAIHGLNRIADLNAAVSLYFLTGRPDKTRHVTAQWIREYLPRHSHCPILMRPDGDFRKADVYKEEAILKVHNMYPARSKIFIDDDLRNIDMYKRHGILLKAPECWDVIL